MKVLLTTSLGKIPSETENLHYFMPMGVAEKSLHLACDSKIILLHKLQSLVRSEE